MDQRFPERLGRGLLLAPLVFVVHSLEESPGFVPWFNARVTEGITQDSFLAVSFVALLITVVLTISSWATRSEGSIILMVAWLSFLMLTNAIFHITGAIVDRGYVPGLVTAIVLYLPYCAWVTAQVVRSRRLPIILLVVTAVLGGIPMAVHGYRILFLGTRLF